MVNIQKMKSEIGEVEKKFEAAVNVIRTLPKDGPFQPSNEMMLKFYGLFKQATLGPCNEAKPSFYEIVKVHKWNAWKSCFNLSKEEAMKSYINELNKIVETMAFSEDVASYIETVNNTDHEKDIVKLSENLRQLTSSSLSVNAGSVNGDIDIFTTENSNISKEICIYGEKLKLSKFHNENSGKDFNENLHEHGNYDIQCNGNGTVKLNNSNGCGENNFIKDKKEAFYLIEDERISGESSFQNNPSRSILNKNLNSDTEDSDEEYSVPAEAPELLKQTQSKPEFTKLGVSHGSGDAESARMRQFSQQGGEANQMTSGRNSNSPHDHGTSQHSHMSGGTGGGGRRGSNLSPLVGQNQDSRQLMLVLQQIQRDMSSLVDRLNCIETEARNRHREVCPYCESPCVKSGKSFWWPFPELSPRTTFFLAIWPIMVHVGLKMFRIARERRVKRNL